MKKLLSGILAFALTLTVAVTPIGENLNASINKLQMLRKTEMLLQILWENISKLLQER